MDTAKMDHPPIASWNRMTFLNIYPGRGDVGPLGSFKDMMHGLGFSDILNRLFFYATR
jgi:hypothetical protein